MKLSIASPFKCPWQHLVNDWNAQKKDAFYVLREKSKLQQIQQCLYGKEKLSSLHLDDNCLVPISMTMDHRGAAERFSLICLPKKSDLNRNSRKIRSFEYGPVYVEPLKTDANEKQRKELRIKHLKLLKRLRKRRVRAKRKKQQYAERNVIIAPPHTAKLIAEQAQTMRELWLPTAVIQIRQQCSREVVGYLAQCQFSYLKAKVAGIGYVTVKGLDQLLKQVDNQRKAVKVLIRSPNSLNYRFASIAVR